MLQAQHIFLQTSNIKPRAQELMRLWMYKKMWHGLPRKANKFTDVQNHVTMPPMPSKWVYRRQKHYPAPGIEKKKGLQMYEKI